MLFDGIFKYERHAKSYVFITEYSFASFTVEQTAWEDIDAYADTKRLYNIADDFSILVPGEFL